MKEVLKKMKIKCSKKLKKTHLSDGAYNLLIEAIVLYGLLINLITCAFFADYVAMIPLRALVIGYLLISIIGIVMLTRYKAVLVKFVGYNMIVIPCGITLSTIISDYAGRSDLVLQALIITTMITFCMITLSCIFPKVFCRYWENAFCSISRSCYCICRMLFCRIKYRNYSMDFGNYFFLIYWIRFCFSTAG